MALLRITSCDYQPAHDRYMLGVDCFYPDDMDKEDRTYLIIASLADICTQEKLYQYIEQNILAQRNIAPSWVGVTWKSTRV